MNITAIVIAAAVIAVTGIVVGIGLGIFGEKFKVEIDPKQAAIRECLPGNNCGGCGYPGCDGLAQAIFEGNAPVTQCPVGQQPVWDKISEVMGVSSEGAVQKVAFVKCLGDCAAAPKKYDYYGYDDCVSLSMVPGGNDKACEYGCLGHGSCVKACSFDAIHIEKGVAVVDQSKCKGCSACIKACPRNMIELVPVSAAYRVSCSNHDAGKAVMPVCGKGCIGCTLCTKQCENDAIRMENNLAVIDYSKCTGCGKCAEKCPRHIITMHHLSE